MLIAVASGKGGTGKTTVATNLAAVMARGVKPVYYADCDVEAPNGHIFLKPEIRNKEMIGLPIPVVNEELCDRCRLCSEACQFNAIIIAGRQVMTFSELCHGCGGCALVCPKEAISEKEKELGVIETGQSGPIFFLQGRLKIGEALSSHLVARVKERLPREGIRIIDAPPGTSCPVVESVRGVDLLLLVTEPTPFGLHDLRLAVEMARKLGRPSAVVINRFDIGDGRTERYCCQEGLPVLMRIPDDRKIAESYSRGELAVERNEGLQKIFHELAARVIELAGGLEEE